MGKTPDQWDDLLEDWFNAQIVYYNCQTAGVPHPGLTEGTFARIYNRANDTRQALAEALSER